MLTIAASVGSGLCGLCEFLSSKVMFRQPLLRQPTLPGSGLWGPGSRPVPRMGAAMGSPLEFIDSAAAAQRSLSHTSDWGAAGGREQHVAFQEHEVQSEGTQTASTNSALSDIIFKHIERADLPPAPLDWLTDAFPGKGLITASDLREAAKEGLDALMESLHVSAAPDGTRSAVLRILNEITQPAGGQVPHEQSLEQNAGSDQSALLTTFVQALSQQQAAPATPRADWEHGACGEREKAAMQELAEAAQYGQPGDDWWPKRTTLDRMATAAGYGYWAPPESTPDETKSVLLFLKELVPVLHAEIWQWRSTPATALNQISLRLDIATAKNMPPAQILQLSIYQAARIK